MNAVDISVLAIMAISVLMGLMRGLTREILGLLTWAGSAFAAYVTHPLSSGIAKGYIANPMIADWVSGIVMFVIFLIAFSIIANVLAGAVRESALGGVDRSLGFAYGIARGAILLCAIEVVFTLFTPRINQPAAIQNARFTQMIRRGGDALVPIVPKAWLDHFPRPGAVKEEATRQVIGHLLQPQGTSQPQAPQQPQPVQPLQPQLQQPQQQPQPQQQAYQLPQKIDPEKAADSLASLQPQAIESKRQDEYNSRQRRDMDRLLQSATE